jgi:predicted dehydrogenase
MSVKKLSLGVIGCGRIAQAHLAAIEQLQDEAELIAVVDTDVEKAKFAANRFGARICSTRYEEVLERRDVDAVIITLPNHLHHPVALTAARAKKHILIEKPMALNTAQAMEMAAEADRHRILFMVGQSRRFSDAVFELERRLPQIGALFRVQVSFLVHFPSPPTAWWKKQEEAGGLVIFLQGSHSLDSLLTWMKKIPTRVCAFSSKQNFQWEGEDEADILLSFDAGEVASVHLSLSTAPAIHEAILVGTKGVIRLTEYVTGEPFGFGYHLDLNGHRIFSGDQEPSNYTLQLREFVHAVRAGRQPIASGDEIARTTMPVLEAARLSDLEKRIVILGQ